MRKRKADAEEEDDASKSKKVPKSQEEQIKDSTTPYWNVPYEKQVCTFNLINFTEASTNNAQDFQCVFFRVCFVS